MQVRATGLSSLRGQLMLWRSRPIEWCKSTSSC